MKLVGGPAIEFKIAGQGDDVVAGDRRGLAGVARLTIGEAVYVAENQFGEAMQETAAFQRCRPPPGALVERRASRLHGRVDIIQRAVGDLADDRPRRGLQDVDLIGSCRRAPLAVDEIAGLGHRFVFSLLDRPNGDAAARRPAGRRG